MKKILMALAAAAILAGCSKNEQENVDGFTPKQIKFTNLNDKLTRAANDGNDPYRVYAAWSGGTGWFINDQVSASDVHITKRFQFAVNPWNICKEFHSLFWCY